MSVEPNMPAPTLAPFAAAEFAAQDQHLRQVRRDASRYWDELRLLRDEYRRLSLQMLAIQAAAGGRTRSTIPDYISTLVSKLDAYEKDTQ
jgi:hypothetical protein